MVTALGLGTVTGTGIESVYGTPVAIDKRHAINSESLQRSQEVLQSNAISGNLGFFRRAGVIPRRAAAGNLVVELAKQNMGRWAQLMAGSSAAPVQQGATTAYLQTHPAGPLNRFLTLQKSLRDISGTEVAAFTYHGVVCTGWEMSVSVDEIPTLTLNMDAEDVETATSSAAMLALPEPEHVPFNFTHVGLEIDAVPASLVTSMSATGTNSQDTNAYFLGGGGTKAQPQVNDFRMLSGSLTAEFAATDFYDHFVAYDAHSLKLEFVAEIIEATDAYRWTLDIPEVRFSGSSPVMSGPNKVTIDAPWEAMFDGTNPAYTIEIMSTDTSV